MLNIDVNYAIQTLKFPSFFDFYVMQISKTIGIYGERSDRKACLVSRFHRHNFMDFICFSHFLLARYFSFEFSSLFFEIFDFPFSEILLGPREHVTIYAISVFFVN